MKYLSSLFDALRGLKNPSAAFRGKPFWAWNGKLDKNELLRQIDLMAQMGFGGFFMHSRTGLSTEYLGDEWFALIRACAEYASSKGLEAWLYDEDRWPSGTAGGLVTQNPEYVMSFISRYDDDCPSGTDNSRNGANPLSVLARFAVKNGRDYYRVDGRSGVKPGYSYCVFARETMEKSGFYNGSAYLDTMNPDAVRAYLNSTHEKYKRFCGDLFGNAIKGIFTDEPHRGALFTGFGLSNKNRFKMCPYTPALFSEHKKLWNEELSDKLPELFLGEFPNTVAFRYIETVQRLFIDAYAKPCQNWCAQNKLLLTGHVLHEDSLTAQTSLSGSVMRFYEFMDYPGIDNLTLHNNCYHAVAACASVARQLNKPFVLSEMYAASGWDAGLEQFKQAGDWQAFYGITLRCPHLSMYSMAGEAKRDYPSSILHQSGLERDFKYLEDYFSRLNLLTVESERLTDILVISPIEAMRLFVNEGWAQGFSLRDKAASDAEEKHLKIFEELAQRHIAFDYADEDILARFYSVNICERADNEADKNGDENGGKGGAPVFRIGNAEYREVLVCGEPIRETTGMALAEFERKGGIVRYNCADIVSRHILSADKGLAVQARKFADGYLLIAMNFDRERDLIGTRIQTAFKGFYAEEIDMLKGETTGAVFDAEIIQADIYRGRERVYILRKGSPDKGKNDKERQEAKENEREITTVTLNGEYPYELLCDNALPLDRASIFKDGEKFFEGDILEGDRRLREKLGIEARGGEMPQPWFIKKNNPAADAELCAVEVRYDFEIDAPFKKENGAISKLKKEVARKNAPLPYKKIALAAEGDFEVYANGQRLTPSNERWIDACFKTFDLTGKAKSGKNIVALKGRYTRLSGFEAVYLIGSFGVSVPDVKSCASAKAPNGFGRAPKLIELPEKLAPENFGEQGLPFYGGGIRLFTGATGRFRIRMEKTPNTAVVKYIAGDKTEYACFYPYEAEIDASGGELVAEIVLSRRNTFGPLHQRELTRYYCDPNCFVSVEGNLNILD
ncbi:MAG: hypothetical protein LBS99_02220 [Clostridiales bacterium]|jgi:hypothetical protein|nr:hypothetical protein [Clostridiales bacterium]